MDSLNDSGLLWRTQSETQTSPFSPNRSRTRSAVTLASSTTSPRQTHGLLTLRTLIPLLALGLAAVTFCSFLADEFLVCKGSALDSSSNPVGLKNTFKQYKHCLEFQTKGSSGKNELCTAYSDAENPMSRLVSGEADRASSLHICIIIFVSIAGLISFFSVRMLWVLAGVYLAVVGCAFAFVILWLDVIKGYIIDKYRDGAQVGDEWIQIDSCRMGDSFPYILTVVSVALFQFMFCLAVAVRSNAIGNETDDVFSVRDSITSLILAYQRQRAAQRRSDMTTRLASTDYKANSARDQYTAF